MLQGLWTISVLPLLFYEFYQGHTSCFHLAGIAITACAVTTNKGNSQHQQNKQSHSSHIFSPFFQIIKASWHSKEAFTYIEKIEEKNRFSL